MDFIVKQMPEKRVTGLKVSTDMERGAKDCVEVWEKFAGYVNGIGSYGVSITTDMEKGEFDYVAAIDSPCALDGQNNMVTVVISGGLYAVCQSSKLEELPQIYNYFYNDWIVKQSDYCLVTDGKCYEYYYPDYRQTGSYEICFPVVKN